MKIGYFVDWVEVYCVEKQGNDPISRFSRAGYKVEIAPYTTRVYEQVLSIFDSNNVPVGVLTRIPLSVKDKESSGILAAGSCHFKINNRECYQENVGGRVMELCNIGGLYIKSISRVDFCADFQYFFNGLNPNTLISGFASMKYLKIGQPRFSLHGTTEKGYNAYNSVLFGSKNSNVYTRFYCKTIEMAEVGMKQWIVDCWRALGFDMARPVWRVEFAVKAPGRRMLDKKTAEVQEITIEDLCSRDKIRHYFLSLSKRYFVFVRAREGVRKYNLDKLDLFDYREEVCKYTPLPTTHSGVTKRTDKMVISYLRDQAKDYYNYSDAERVEMARVAGFIRWHKYLTEWERWKFGSLGEVMPVGEPVINPLHREGGDSERESELYNVEQKEIW